MHPHVIALSRWLRAHRYQLTLAAGLLGAMVLLAAATPLLLAMAGIEWKRSRRRGRMLSVLLLVLLARGARWLWLETRGIPHKAWHPCAQCGAPIEAPSRAAYCSHACRNYTRLERDALDTDPRIAERAERRLRNLRLRQLADTYQEWEEVPF